MTYKKRLPILLLVAVLIVCLGANVFAATTYDTGYGRFVAEKISHPNKGVKTTDGIVDPSGEGDRGQTDAAVIGYGNHMYIGTSYGSVARVIQQAAQANNWDADFVNKTMDVLYNGTLFSNLPTDANNSVMLKINTKSGVVTVLQTGKGASYTNAIMFHDKIYFTTSGPSPSVVEATPTETDDADQVRTVYWGEYISSGTAAKGMAVANDRLLIAMNGANGAYIIQSKDPSTGHGSFDVVATQDQLYNYPATGSTGAMGGAGIWDMESVNGKLYVSCVTSKNTGTKQGFAILEGSLDQASDKWSFREVVGNTGNGAIAPFGITSDRATAADLVNHNGSLYIGGANDFTLALTGIMNLKYENIYKDLTTPAKLWKMSPDGTITEVATANGIGLGSRFNQAIPAMASYDDKLYVGTLDISSMLYPWMQFTNGDLLKRTPEEWVTQIKYIKVLIEALIEKGKMMTGSKDKEGVAARANALDVSKASNIDGQEAMVNEFLEKTKNLTAEVQLKLVKDLLVMAETMDAMTPYLGSAPSNEKALSPADATFKEETPGDAKKKFTEDDFFNALTIIVKIYDQVSPMLPEKVTNILGKIVNQENVNNLRYFVDTAQYLKEGERGFDLLLSKDGQNFNVLTKNGFGDPYNHSAEAISVTFRGISIGTGNPFNGAQAWNVDDLDNPVVDSDVPNTYHTYDKYVKGELHRPIDVPITLNGNHIKEIQYQYKPLTEGTDYVVTSTGIQFTQAFLDTLPLDKHRVRITFNVGKWSDCYINVIDTTPETGFLDGLDFNLDFLTNPATGDPSDTTTMALIGLLGLIGLTAAGGLGYRSVRNSRKR